MTRLDVIRRAILADLTVPQKITATAMFVAMPTLVRAALGASANPVPFVTYFPAVLLGAIFLGWRWGALITVISAIIVNRLFLTRPWLENAAPPDLAIFLFFSASCALLVLSGDTLRRTVRELDKAGRERENLTAEMYHRVQNTLAVVGALIRTNQSDEVEQFRSELLGRIQALSKANHVLQDDTPSGASVIGLVTQAITPFAREDCFVVQGRDRHLDARSGHQLILILHELCTNALKHGSLSCSQGQVLINWSEEPQPFVLLWQESGGPPVDPPTRKGLGSRLFSSRQAFAVDVEYEATGVRCTVTPC